MFRFFSVLFLLGLLFFIFPDHQVYATIDIMNQADPKGIYIVCHTADDLDTAGFKCLEGMFHGFMITVVILIGIGLFLVIIYGGFRYITAGGDMKAIDTSKKILTYGFTGLGISISIYFIFAVLLKSLDVGGVNLGNFLQFSIPCNTSMQSANDHRPPGMANYCP